VNSSLRVALGVTLIVLGATAGVALHRMLRPRATVRPAAASERAPRPQSPAQQSRVIPMVLPNLTLADLAGVSHRLSDWTGHPVIINFWATWCEPCRREIPLLIRLRHERSGAGLAIVGIAVDFRDAVVKYTQHAGIDYPVLIGEDEGVDAVHAFGMDLVLPFSVFADQAGRVVAVKVGELHPDEAGFILDRVQDIDRGSLSLATARQQIETRLRDLAVERAKRA
jgi:thiol-disulfide isomerase/thioredoxin